MLSFQKIELNHKLMELKAYSFRLSPKQADELIGTGRQTCEYYERLVIWCDDPQLAWNWTIMEFLPLIRRYGYSSEDIENVVQWLVEPCDLADLILMVKNNEISQ